MTGRPIRLLEGTCLEFTMFSFSSFNLGCSATLNLFSAASIGTLWGGPSFRLGARVPRDPGVRAGPADATLWKERAGAGGFAASIAAAEGALSDRDKEALLNTMEQEAEDIIDGLSKLKVTKAKL